MAKRGACDCSDDRSSDLGRQSGLPECVGRQNVVPGVGEASPRGAHQPVELHAANRLGFELANLGQIVELLDAQSLSSSSCEPNTKIFGPMLILVMNGFA